jgi:hypothetical protein
MFQAQCVMGVEQAKLSLLLCDSRPWDLLSVATQAWGAASQPGLPESCPLPPDFRVAFALHSVCWCFYNFNLSISPLGSSPCSALKTSWVLHGQHSEPDSKPVMG